MASEPPSSDEGSAAQLGQEGSPSGTKRPRQRGPSTSAASSLREASNPPLPSGSGTTFKAPNIPRGSSRDAPDTMQRSSTPPERATQIRYTRTGRVSKATKGQRVHQCEECGKTYTRAEHLRRHEQNHKPGAFPCDIPGCGRSFYREDLLTRHKARHNDPLNPPSRRASIDSRSSAPPADQGIPATALPPASVSSNFVAVEQHIPPTTHAAPTAAPPTRDRRYQNSSSFCGPQPIDDFFQFLSLTPKYIPLNELERSGAPPISIDTSASYTNQTAIGPYNWCSPPYSPSGDNEPSDGYLDNGQPYYGPHIPRTRIDSHAVLGDYYPPAQISRSPVSASSTTFYMPSWGHSTQNAAYPHYSTPSSEHSYGCATGTQNLYLNDSLVSRLPQISASGMHAQERDFMEQNDLATPTLEEQPEPFGLHLTNSNYETEQLYLSAYWQAIHPLYPVAHKPTFSLHLASPLLRAAILALGAQSLGNVPDFTNARILHERCLKVLKKRTVNEWHTYRVCDLQAVLLVEIYAIFKSRRPPLQFSNPFEDAYRWLSNDSEAWNPASAYETSAQSSSYLDDSNEAIADMYESKCKHRLLLAYYVLDQQHSILFGRARTSCLTLPGTSLPFVQAQMYWDAPVSEQPAEVVDYGYMCEALETVAGMDEPAQWPHDPFRSMAILACMTDSSNDPAILPMIAADDSDVARVLYGMEPSPHSKLVYHTFMLCRHTPIRDLLACAGESWVMAEKMSSQAEYTAAQIETRQWAERLIVPNFDVPSEKSQTPIRRALAHALAILEIHQSSPKTGSLFQEWSIYLAAVVIWARAYVSENESRRPPALPVPRPTEPRLSAHELDQAVITLINSGPSAAISWRKARSALLWTKTKIGIVDVPHNCGLTNGALDVLGKLITRGNEKDWF